MVRARKGRESDAPRRPGPPCQGRGSSELHWGARPGLHCSCFLCSRAAPSVTVVADCRPRSTNDAKRTATELGRQRAECCSLQRNARDFRPSQAEGRAPRRRSPVSKEQRASSGPERPVPSRTPITLWLLHSGLLPSLERMDTNDYGHFRAYWPEYNITNR